MRRPWNRPDTARLVSAWHHSGMVRRCAHSHSLGIPTRYWTPPTASSPPDRPAGHSCLRL